ncbi:MAG: efflux RND transporter periplasmic adaptor subunit [Thermodesulfobacteriota bacterium]
MKREKMIVVFMILVGFLIAPSLGLGQAHQHGTSSEKAKAPSVKPSPQKEAAREEVPVVEIPTDKQQLIGLKTTMVAVRPLQKTIRTVGRVEYDERKMATVNLKFEGWIEKLHINYTGSRVKKGEPLAEVYSPELLATQQEFLNALKWRGSKKEGFGAMLAKDAETILEAAKQRLRLWDITEEQIKKIEETGRPIKTLTLYSPVNGYVIQKMIVQGMKVMPGEKLFDIVDLSTVWVVADIYENELPAIKIGDQAAISLSYLPGKTFSSKIDYIYPTLSGETRTAKIRFTLPNAGGQLKPQMFTDVTLKINLGKRLTVPEDAVIDTGLRQIVYVDKGEGNFEPREISVGLRTDKMIEVIRGLRAGEKVASSANFLIDSEAKLKGITPKSQNPGARSQKPE